MKRVVIESPLRGNRLLNKLYARVCALDCLLRGESPYASHLFFDHEDLLDDEVPLQRTLGIKAGFAWGAAAELRVFYLDLGESDGMKLARDTFEDQPFQDRKLFAHPAHGEDDREGFRLHKAWEESGRDLGGPSQSPRTVFLKMYAATLQQRLSQL